MTDVNNEKALKILERQYSSFIGLEDQWDFFRGLAEYVKTAQELASTKPIIEALAKQQEAARTVYESINTEALKELTKAAEQIAKVAQIVKEKYEPVAIAVKNLQDRLNGEILSSERLSGLNDSIFNVARQLKENGLAEKIKQYENEQRKIKNISGNYTFSPAYERLEDEANKIKRREQIEPWGVWQHLPFTERIIFEPEKVVEEVRSESETDPQKRWTLINLFGVVHEMESIRSDAISENDVVYFKIKDFRSYTQRFHNYLTAELLKTDSGKQLQFDPSSSILIFQGKEILIAKSKNTDPHYLLQTLFKDPKKLWSYDEVSADWGSKFNKKKWKKFYNAAHKVNQKVAEKTTIGNFLETSKMTVTINKIYLSAD